MNDNKPIISFIISEYNQMKKEKTNYKVLECKFGSSCSKGSRCCYCHKGEVQNKTVKTEFYDLIKEKNLFKHIKEHSKAFKFICNYCDEKLKSLEYINKDSIDFKEELSGEPEWIIDLCEEYFRRRVFCYRHLRNLYNDECSIKCTGGINCCFGNHDIDCKLTKSKIIFNDGENSCPENNTHIDVIIKNIIERMKKDVKKYKNLINGSCKIKENKLFVEYFKSLIISIREYSSWVYNKNDVEEIMESVSPTKDASTNDYLRDFSPGFVADVDLIQNHVFPVYDDLSYDLYSDDDSDIEISNQTFIRLDGNQVINISCTDTDNFQEQKRSKSQDYPKETNKFLRSNSKSFSCVDDLKFLENSYNIECTSDDKIDEILNDNFELSDSFDDINFDSVDRSLVSPATWRWIKDFRKSKTPEFRGSSSPVGIDRDFSKLDCDDFY